MNQKPIRNRFRGKLIEALLLCCTILSGLLAICSQGAETSRVVPAAQIDQSVIAVLVDHGFQGLRVISHIDLTMSFKATSQWTLVVVEDDNPSPQQLATVEDHGPVIVCMVKVITPNCSGKFYRPVASEGSSFDRPFHLLSDKVVFASRGESRPLLLVKLCGAEGANGDCAIATALYKYDKRADSFLRVFLNVTGRNNNQDTRFVERGSLQGDVIVDYPTDHAPYTYWIEVYGPGKLGGYVRILHYRGRTGYGDGNPLSVADSEMPEILRRLGLWRPGDSLPVPTRLPSGCNHLSMHNGEEWCKK